MNSIIDELSKALSPDQKEWISRNSATVVSSLRRMSEAAIESHKVREARREGLLTPIRDMHYPGDERFSFRESGYLSYVLGRRFVRCDGVFKEEFEPSLELRVPASRLFASIIRPGDKETPYATEPEIRARVGKDRTVFLAEACYFLRNVPDLRYWYAFYATGSKGVRWLTASWYDGWYLCASPTGYPDEIRNGGCLVTRGLPR